MARVKKSSRHAALLAAFMCVMAATGILAGAVGGVMLALLTRALLGLEANTMYLMGVTTLLGMVSALLVSVLMVSRRSTATVAIPPKVAAPTPVESN
jgi:hypothetical protein